MSALIYLELRYEMLLNTCLHLIKQIQSKSHGRHNTDIQSDNKIIALWQYDIMAQLPWEIIIEEKGQQGWFSIVK